MKDQAEEKNIFKIMPINTENIKQTIGENTERVEQKAKEYFDKFSPYYTQQEPFNRGLVLLAGIVLIAITIYLLTASDKDKSTLKKERAEKEAEERLLRK